MTQCPLCGYEFDETLLSCHSSCAFNKGCAIICCPNCGYQTTDESKSWIAGWLRKAFTRRETNGQPGRICSLSLLKSGQTGKVVSVEGRQEQLSVFGLVPGAHVTLEQRQPAFVLKVGYTELSIERDLADQILVEVA